MSDIVDFDVEAEIERELQNLPPTDDDGNDALELENASPLQYEQFCEDDQQPVLEKMDSWADYLQTIASRDLERSDFDTQLEAGEDADNSEGSIARDVAVSSEEDGGDTSQFIDVALGVGEQEEFEDTETEFNARLSNLHEISASEEALLQRLQAEARNSGVTLAQPIGHELVEKTLGQTIANVGALYEPDREGVVAIAPQSPAATEGFGDEVTTLTPTPNGPTIGYDVDVIRGIMPNLDLPDEERALLRAEEQNLRADYEYIIGKQREEAGEQAKLRYRLDNLQTTKTKVVRTVRQQKQEMRDLQEKAKRIINWLGGDGKIAFEKEKERTSALMARMSQLLATHETLQKEAEDRLASLWKRREESSWDVEEVNEQLQPLQEEQAELSFTVKTAHEQILLQESMLEEKKRRRDSRLLRQLEVEEAARKLELQLLLESLKKQLQVGEATVADLSELESLELKGTGIGKIPDLTVAPKIKHVILDNNTLTDLKGLEALKDLRSLSLQGNRYATLDLSWFTELRTLTAAGNELTQIQHIESCEHLQVLDLSNNPLGTAADVRRASSLQVLLLRNTQLVDVSYMEALGLLIYLDLSENRLSSMEGLSDCKMLQYLNCSDNAFNELPRIPNHLLYEFNASGNNIRNLTVHRWSPLLRILDVSNCHVAYIEPLAMIPFLEELYISNNYITDFASIFGIAICQSLKVLDLSENPIARDHNFHIVISLLFPSMKVINGASVDGHKRYGRVSPVKIVKWCKAAVDYLQTFVEDEHQKDEYMKSMDDFRRIVQAQERNIETFMGRRYKPFLQYLYAPSTFSDKENAKVQMLLQERRISWLGGMLKQHVAEIEGLMKKREPHFDIPLVFRIDDLAYRIENTSASVVQAMWRGKKARRFKVRRTRAARMIQRSWRQYVRRKSEKAHQRLQEQAAIAIQAAWKGHVAHENFKKIRRNARLASTPKRPSSSPKRQSRSKSVTPTPRTESSPVPRQVPSPDVLEEEDESDLHEWLEKANENEFDDKMNSYLGDEKLIHYPTAEPRPPVVKKILRQYTESINKDAETLLRQKFDTLLNSPKGQIIGARDPLRMLLLSRGMVKTPLAGQTTFGSDTSSRGASPMGQNNSLGDAELTLFSRRSPLKPGKEREIQKESGAERAISKGAGYNISERGTRNGETPAGHGQRQRDGDGSEKSVQQPQAGELEQADSDGGWNLSSGFTRALLEKRLGRDLKLRKQAKMREQLKDPMQRLKALQVLQRAATKQGASMEVPGNDVIYEWDIIQTRKHQINRRAYRLPPLQMPELSEHKEASGEPILLINNYVAKKLVGAAVDHSQTPSPQPMLTSGHHFEPNADSGVYTMPAHHSHVHAEQSHRHLYHAFDHSNYLPSLKGGLARRA